MTPGWGGLGDMSSKNKGKGSREGGGAVGGRVVEGKKGLKRLEGWVTAEGRKAEHRMVFFRVFWGVGEHGGWGLLGPLKEKEDKTGSGGGSCGVGKKSQKGWGLLKEKTLAGGVS